MKIDITLEEIETPENLLILYLETETDMSDTEIPEISRVLNSIKEKLKNK